MPTDTTEAALEACIERFLTGGVSPADSDGQSLKDVPTTRHGGYLRGKSSDFNAEFAIDEVKL